MDPECWRVEAEAETAPEKLPEKTGVDRVKVPVPEALPRPKALTLTPRSR